jgi:pimeloyl-ACP methyl ester carboxylesterase
MRKNLITTSARWGRISYRKNGDFPGPAIVFVHGAIGDSRLFRYQLRYFGQRHKTIAVDLPGHGRSDTGNAPDMPDFIEAIEDVIDQEGISSYVLVGHSMGGGVCLEAHQRGLPGLKGMVLVSTSSVLPVTSTLADIVKRDDMDALAKLIAGAVFGKSTEILAGFAKQALNGIDRDVIRADVELCGRMDYTGMLAGIDIPVLVVSNRFDLVVAHEKSATLHQGIPNSRHVIFEENGHIPFFENSHSFNAAVDVFLKEIGFD